MEIRSIGIEGYSDGIGREVAALRQEPSLKHGGGNSYFFRVLIFFSFETISYAIILN